MLTPNESHAEHAMAVALMGVLLAPAFEADPARVFLVGLAHHLMNATLPDAGHAGDVFLGARAQTLRAAATERALAQLNDPLRSTVEAALQTTRHLGTPEAKAFHAADVLDRVLEIAWHARTAAFTMDAALNDMDLVHEGFTQTFQQDVLRRAGLATASDHGAQNAAPAENAAPLE